MSRGNMRHFNSPEERAAREDGPAAAPRGSQFRHFNSPDEVARRQGQPAPRRVVQASGEAIVPARAAGMARRPKERVTGAATGSTEERLAQLEWLVFALLESPEEAREFRMQLNNQAAQTETQLDLVARMKALEQAVDGAAERVAEGALFLTLESKVRALEQTIDALEFEEGDEPADDTHSDTQPPPAGDGAPPTSEPTT